ncbi:MAG: PAS domain-containing protein, partial [candidate division Zixibacteria bacterium]
MEERTTTAIKKMTGPTGSADVSKFAETYASFNRIVNDLQRQYIELKEEFTAQNLELARTNLKLVRLTKSNLAATEFLNGVLNSVPIGVITVNQNSVITHCNPTAMAIFGIEEKSVIGRKYSEVIKTEPGQSVVSAVKTFATGEEFSATEQIIKLADNRELNLSISTAKIEDESGKFVGAVEVIQDMTKVRRLEQEIARLNTLAALGEMAAVIAHEVRNPLSGISGFASLLARDLEDDGPKMKLVLKIKRGAEILNETVTKLLNYTRFSELNRTDSSYLKYLESIIEDFNTQLAEAGKKAKVDFEFPAYLARRNVIISLDQIL